MKKLLPLEELAKTCEELRASGKKIVLCGGVWDWLHPGHNRHLKAAKREGDVLIVVVTPDKYVNKGPGRPVYDENLRAESLCDLECVDYVAINQWPTCVETIKLLKPDVYAKGSDYARAEDDITGGITLEEAAVKEVGGRLHLTEEITFSSSGNINRYSSPYPAAAKDFLEAFRKKYVASDIIDALKALRDIKVLIVGDTIIDEYHYCQTLGKTPKDNIIAVRYLNQEAFAGGVLAAANHIAGFCNTVDLVTGLGKEYDHSQFILDHLKPNIHSKFFQNPSAPTTVKRRFVDPSFITKLFEVAYLEEKAPESLENEISTYLWERLRSNHYDLVLITDYGHGFITKSIAHTLVDSGRFLAVNTQANSANSGFNVITKFPQANYICLDEPELRLACRDKFERPEILIKEISRQLSCSAIAITQGHKGSIVYDGMPDKEFFYNTPALVEHSVDRMGAGDAYLSITAACVASGMMMELVGFIGNAVAALKIQTIGNREGVQPVALFKFIQTLLK